MLTFTTNGNFIDFTEIDDVSPVTASCIHPVMSLHKSSKCVDWSYPEDTSRISFTIDEKKYENVPITSIYFDDVVMSAQDDFATNMQSMFTGLGSPGSSSYLVYTAKLERSGDVITATEILNTLGLTPTFVVDGVGTSNFYLYDSGITFDVDKTLPLGNTTANAWGGTVVTFGGYVVNGEGGYPASMIYFDTLDKDGFPTANWNSLPIYLKIEVYP
jgi:hypothetical protein